MKVKIGGDFDHPRPLTATYRPVLVRLPGDLLAAAWLQFATQMADARPWRICAGCDLPFLVRRVDQEVCPESEPCRKAKQRRRRKAAP